MAQCLRLLMLLFLVYSSRASRNNNSPAIRSHPR